MKRPHNRSEKGRRAHALGHRLEYIALIHFLLKGYRILGFRLKTPEAEIDLLVLKGKRLAMVEVKSRQTLEEALLSVSEVQRQRLWQAGQKLMARRPKWQAYQLELDLYLMAKGHWPQHIKSAFSEI